MKLSKKSVYSGKTNIMEIPITEEQYEQGIEMYNKGFLLQCAFPSLSCYQREFILTGMTEDEWEKLS